MTATRSRRPRAATLGVLVIAAAFIAGPTPGDVGGCGGDQSNITLPGQQSEAEYDYFDQGLCAHMCYRLRTLGVLCNALESPPAGCDPLSPEAYRLCVRGSVRRSVFGAQSCPHSCANYHGTFVGATEQDVQVCGHVIDGMSEGDLAGIIQQPPAQCVAVCQ